ncbi:MAG: AAA family ATPase [Gammaproteobacteria bacterium]|jgi:SpoVK/Ycf46/Vps4 family AAA+-type ATPase|nr:AAA family ATPase [Gammaproteobacteria bacterium]MBT4492679.1 AAA family ATPase [Gammaproteobacteria bacterium]MBT7372062.1 AAA family ATPase [Gammaproteobacteria bacterium]
MTNDLKDLSLILDSKVPILAIESFEEPRVIEMVTGLAVKRTLPLFTWSITEGLNRLGFGERPETLESPDAEHVLRTIKDTNVPGIYILCDFHPYLKDEPINIRLLREIAMRHHNLGHTVVLLSHSIDPPAEIKRYTARFELSMPTEEQLMHLVREEANNWSRSKSGRPVRSASDTFKKLVQNLKGLPIQDARQLVRGAIFDDGVIDETDIPELNKAKFALMDMEGVLSFQYDTAKFTDVGGLLRLKEWLEKREDSFRDSEIGTLDAPKGIMLLGVQGSGKSLAAKAVAGLWSLPLLRLDFGALYNKFYGETERNLRDALKLADMMSPCVLWLDEIEKGISTDQNDSGISSRVLGTLLTWMSERESKAFIVATSNDISRLPPELVRKGRLDEIFFVDLPNPKVRADIFQIHLEKRAQDPSHFDLGTLADISDGFSGAEIEQAVVSALYSVAASDAELSMEALSSTIHETNPLSVVMEEKINQLRSWAEERCVFADES